MRFMLLNRFVGVLFGLFIMLQVYQTPLYGRALWNPSHVLMSLTLYPMLFLYVFDMLRPGSVSRRLLMFTFLPTAALTALYFTFEALFGKLPLFAYYADLRNYLNMPQLWVEFVGAGLSVVLMGYFTVRAVGMLRLHKRNLESNFSYTEGSTLGWMWFAIGIALFQWFVVMMGITLEGNLGQMIALFLFTIEPTIVTALIIRQKDLYGNPDGSIEPDFEPDDDIAELSPEKRNFIQRRFLSMLYEEEVYKNPELSCRKLCEMLGTNRSYLSLIINKDMQTTFYELINNCRLEKSKELMKNPDNRNMPLATIAELSGFKNPVVFSRLFKQSNEKTPKEWRKEVLSG